MPNIIEEQAIVVYVALPFQGISWKVHSKFVYGHIKTHPYSPCKNKDGFFLVNVFCSDIWTFLIKCFSHNRILPWFLVQNTFILFYLGLWFCAIPSYCWHYGGWSKCNTFISCTRFCTSKFLLQFKMKVEMWVNGLTKAQDGFVRWMHALVLMRPNGCSVTTWNKHTFFECKPRNQGIHLLILGA